MLKQAYVVMSIVLSLVLLAGAGCKKKADDSTVLVEKVPAQHSVSAVDSAKDLPDLSIPTPSMQANEFTDFAAAVRPPKDIVLNCRFVSEKPVIDGVLDEAVWEGVEIVTTLDFSSQRLIELRSIHDGEMIYFLAKYPDAAASESHKSWFWEAEEEVYKPGMDREDMLVYKWLMTGDALTFQADAVDVHTADIWFWKARRTNPAGYFDDKRHEVTTEESEGSASVKSDKYGQLYLSRLGDDGKSAYQEKIFFEYQGDCVAKYYPRQPQGSRADVQGKGQWKDGYWTIESARKLDTGNVDDVAFTAGDEYSFGVSLYEMANSPIEPDWWQPLYRTGDIYDRLTLVIEKQ